jgi:hypothetical protein
MDALRGEPMRPSPRKPTRSFVTATAAAIISLLALVIPAKGQVSDLRIIQLDCSSNPEVVTIKNFGGAQSLSGWELRSDPVTNAGQVFDLSVAGTLDPGEQASILSGSNAPTTDPASGQYRWALSFKFRNDDPTDFAQIVDSSATIIDQLNCGEEPPPPPTDSDADGVSDDSDNCPAWPNADQSLPRWPVPEDDPDCDGWSTADESSISTHPMAACGAGAWPPDTYEDQLVDSQDLVALLPGLFKSVGQPGYSARLDIFQPGTIIDSQDLVAFLPFLFRVCEPP